MPNNISLNQAKNQKNFIPRLNSSLCTEWIDKDPEPLPFIIDELVPQNMVTLLVAEGGAGKSMLMQIACSCLPTDNKFMGLEVMSGVTAGIFAEDPDSVLHNRQISINKNIEINMEYLAERCYIQSYAGYNATLWAKGNPTQFFYDIENELSCISDLRLLIIDNVALVFEGNENDRNEVTRFLHTLNGFALRLGIGIIISTHTSKTYGSSSQVASGSTAWQNAARSVVELKPETDTHPAKLVLKKANHAKPRQEIELSWVNGVLEKASNQVTSERKNLEIDSTIFDLIEEAWDQDRPWSLAPQAKARYLPKVLMDRFSLRKKAALNAIQKWISTGHLVESQRNTRTKRGLKVNINPFNNQ